MYGISETISKHDPRLVLKYLSIDLYYRGKSKFTGLAQLFGN